MQETHKESGAAGEKIGHVFPVFGKLPNPITTPHSKTPPVKNKESSFAFFLSILVSPYLKISIPT